MNAFFIFVRDTSLWAMTTMGRFPVSRVLNSLYRCNIIGPFWMGGPGAFYQRTS
jgi:hypothetical protein